MAALLAENCINTSRPSEVRLLRLGIGQDGVVTDILIKALGHRSPFFHAWIGQHHDLGLLQRLALLDRLDTGSVNSIE